MAANSKVLQLKIVLTGTAPSIWRRILISADAAFFDLHVAVQDAMGWADCHLHQFFPESPYSSTSRRRITYPMSEAWDDDEEIIDERTTKLAHWLKAPKDRVWYEYDFGDAWMHTISVEKVLSRDTHATNPRLLAGARACPPEDCGGGGGYTHLLEVLADPEHKEHTDMLEWLGLEDAKEFSPEEFEKDGIEFTDPGKQLREIEQQIDTI